MSRGGAQHVSRCMQPPHAARCHWACELTRIMAAAATHCPTTHSLPTHPQRGLVEGGGALVSECLLRQAQRGTVQVREPPRLEVVANHLQTMVGWGGVGWGRVSPQRYTALHPLQTWSRH